MLSMPRLVPIKLLFLTTRCRPPEGRKCTGAISFRYLAAQQLLGRFASHRTLLASVAGRRGKCRNGEYPIEPSPRMDFPHMLATQHDSEPQSGLNASRLPTNK